MLKIILIIAGEIDISCLVWNAKSTEIDMKIEVYYEVDGVY